jgi:hopene-associated glycosyltransferase HpnB
MLDILAALPLIIWLYLLLARGSFWRAEHQLLAPAPPAAAAAAPPRRVVAIIPARDEAEVIAGSVKSLLQQRLAGVLHLIVVDDGSTDDTGGAAILAAASIGAERCLTLISGAPLPSGWTGKLWAMSQGVEAAAEHRPDYLLFTDADIHHEPGNVATLLACAEAQQRDLVSVMVRLSTSSFPERCLIPAFVFFFLMLYPPAWIASRRATTAGAAGGCMLIRPLMLARIGGLATIRSQIIDDCALAQAVKAAGGSICLGLTRSARSTRSYGSFAQIGRMISRTAFNQLRHSYLLLAATLLGLMLAYLLPPLLLLSGRALPIALAAAAWMLMSVAYSPIVRFYRLSWLWSLSLPAVAIFYAGATMQSALQYLRGRGGQWKGRAQDVAQ